MRDESRYEETSEAFEFTAEDRVRVRIRDDNGVLTGEMVADVVGFNRSPGMGVVLGSDQVVLSPPWSSSETSGVPFSPDDAEFEVVDSGDSRPLSDGESRETMPVSEEKSREIVNMVDEWTAFGEDRAYILMAIARRKFNEELSNSGEIVHRRVLTDSGDIEEQVGDLLAMMARHDLHFRLYLTVNARDTVSAYHGFVQEAVSWSQELHDGHEAVHDKFRRVSSEWKSVLHSPEHKADSDFLFDLDGVSKEEAQEFKEAISEEIEIVGWKPTPNGYHVITCPFDYTRWESPVEYDEMSTDGMVNVAELDFRRNQ